MDQRENKPILEKLLEFMFDSKSQLNLPNETQIELERATQRNVVLKRTIDQMFADGLRSQETHARTVSELRARIEALESELRPSSALAEVRPHVSCLSESQHWVRHEQADLTMVWTWHKNQDQKLQWLCIGTGVDPHVAYERGWRYLGVAQFTAEAPPESKLAQDRFQEMIRRAWSPHGI